MTDKWKMGERMKIPSVLKVIGAVFFFSILPAQVHALTPDQVFDKVKDSIVVVKTLDAQGKVKGQGSGVLLPSGKIATNCHVVEGGASYQVGRGKELVRATLYAEDGDKDICLLDAKGIIGIPAQLGKAAGLKVGVPVYAVGAPRGLELSLSDGIVAQLRGGPPPFIQTTAAISPGSSGGGLFDGEGRLVGLTTLYIEGGQNLNFAMPVEWIGEIKQGRKQATGGHSQTEWVKRTTALEELKDWQALLDWCRKWTKSESKNALAWGGLGIAYDNLNRYNDAIEAYRQSLRIDPENAAVWYFLGGAYFNLKRYNDAIDAYRQVLRINPEYPNAWYNLRVTYSNSKLGRYDDAIEAFRQALRIDPKYAEAWNDLGRAYLILKRYNDAIEAYSQSLRIDPENAAVWYFLGGTYTASGNRSAALEVVQKLRRLDPAKADKLFDLIVPR
jgi:tetratricopeptide (TPR) repeat protein